MSISSVHKSDNSAIRHNKKFAKDAVDDLAENDFDHWLAWLQKLLKAHALILYRVDRTGNKLSLNAIGCIPGEKLTTVIAHKKCAIRCAQSASVLRADNGAGNNHSVLCVPDVASSSRNARHVLIIERRAATALDSKTQAKLVSWAFACLETFAGMPAKELSANYLSRWSLARIDRPDSLTSVFAQMLDELCENTGCERCLLSSLKTKNNRVKSIKLIAMSGQRLIDRRLPAAQSLITATEKAYVGKALPLHSLYQPQDLPSIAMQTPVSSAVALCARLTIPVYICDCWYAISLERATERPFEEAEQLSIEQDLKSAMALLALSDSRARGLTAAVIRACKQLCSTVVANVPVTVSVLSVCILALVFLLLPVEHRISAALNIESAERHVLIAPVDGFVKSVAVKAGDSVVKNQVLATLDDADLELQEKKLNSDLKQNQQAYAKALASHDRIEVTRLKEEGSHLQTELSQLQRQSDKMTLKAPFDGIILSGSWDDFLGAAVSSGDTLFTLGSASSHRLVLDVSEYDVKNILAGQPVSIRMSADPSNILLGTVTAIMPLAVAVDGRNNVQVHAKLNQQALLRPGMHGLGKVLVGRQARLMQWLGRATARLVWLGWKLGVLK